LPVRRLLTAIVTINTFVLVYAVYWFDPTNSTLEVKKFLSTSIFILDIAILLISVYLWRWLWKMVPLLSTEVFPDLNGIWEGHIKFQNKSQEEKLNAKVRIRQNLWSISIDLCSTTSKSHTLVAYPTIESGNHRIYYVYHNTPRNPKYDEYKGTSILTVNLEAKPTQLNGSYFTMRATKGTIELKRISINPNEDYELH